MSNATCRLCILVSLLLVLAIDAKPWWKFWAKNQQSKGNQRAIMPDEDFSHVERLEELKRELESRSHEIRQPHATTERLVRMVQTNHELIREVDSRDLELKNLQEKYDNLVDKQEQLFEERVQEAEDKWWRRLETAQYHGRLRMEQAKENTIQRLRAQKDHALEVLAQAQEDLDEMEDDLKRSESELRRSEAEKNFLFEEKERLEKLVLEMRDQSKEELQTCQKVVDQGKEYAQKLELEAEEQQKQQEALMAEQLVEAEDHWWNRLEKAKNTTTLRIQVAKDTAERERDEALEELKRATDRLDALEYELKNTNEKLAKVVETAHSLAALHEEKQIEMQTKLLHAQEEADEANFFLRWKVKEVEALQAKLEEQQNDQTKLVKRRIAEAEDEWWNRLSKARNLTTASVIAAKEESLKECRKTREQELEQRRDLQDDKNKLRSTLVKLEKNYENVSIVVERLATAQEEQTRQLVEKENSLGNERARAKRDLKELTEQLSTREDELRSLNLELKSKLEETKRALISKEAALQDALRDSQDALDELNRVKGDTNVLRVVEKLVQAQTDLESHSSERETRVHDKLEKVTGLLSNNKGLLQALQSKVDGLSQSRETESRSQSLDVEQDNPLAIELQKTRDELKAANTMMEDLLTVFVGEQKEVRSVAQVSDQLLKMHDDYLMKEEEARARSSEDVKEIKQMLQQKETTTRSLTEPKSAESNERGLNNEQDGYRQRETDDIELSCKHSLREAELRAREAEKEKSYITGEKQLLEKLYASMETKYEAILKDIDDATEAYMKEHFETAVRKRTKLLTSELRNQLKDLEESSENALREAEESAASVLELTKEQAKNQTDSLVASHSSALDDMVKRHKLEVDTADEELARRSDELREMQDKLRKGKEEADQLKAVIQEKESSIASLEKQLEASKRSLLAVKSATEKLTVEKEQSHEEIAKLRGNVSEKERVVNLTMSELDDAKTEAGKVLRDLKSQREKSESAIRDLESRLRGAKKEAKYWLDVYERRRYCNFTYVYEDAAMLVNSTQQVATERYAASMEAVDRRIAPVTTKVGELYAAHMKDIVEDSMRKLKPYADKHVSPVLNNVRSSAEDIHFQLGQIFDEILKVAANQLSKCCLPALSLASALEQQISLSGFLREGLEGICDEPKRSVLFSFKAVLVLVLINCRRFVWAAFCRTLGLVIWVFLWPWQLAYRMLRPLFRRSPQDIPTQQTNGSSGKSAAQ